jgi:hypothetical protein
LFGTHNIYIYIFMCVCVFSYLKRLATGQRVLRPNTGEARFYPPFRNGPLTHPASCKIGNKSFPGLKRRKRGLDHPPSSVPPWNVLGWNIPLQLCIKLVYFVTVWFFFLRFFLFFSSVEPCRLNSVYLAFTKN